MNGNPIDSPLSRRGLAGRRSGTLRRLRAGLAGVAAAVFTVTALAASGALPELGDDSGAALSPATERKVGEQSMRELRASGGYLEDPEVNGYLNRLGRRLLAADPAIAGRFEFFAVPSGEINAFALPGGFIGVNTGLVLNTESESQLASVLAHEITHVTQHHLARQVAAQSKSQIPTLAAMVAAILAGSRGGGDAAGGLITGAMAAQTQSQINATREHELEADRIGFQLLVDAGFDARAMPEFFERMQRATRIKESDVPGYLRSHPLTFQRIAEAQHRAAKEPARQVKDSVEFDFVRALLRSYEGRPEEAVARLADELKTGRSRNLAATRYGYAAALLRASDHAAAWREIETLESGQLTHPMLDSLAGQVLTQSGQYERALQRYERALKQHPDYLQLVYDYPQALIQVKDYAKAARFAEDRLVDRRDDAHLHRIAAEAWAALGQQLKSHYHLGEQYAALGNAPAAAEQFELALRSKDGDYRDLVVAETRLRELRAAEQAAAGERGGGDTGRRSSGSLRGPTYH